MSLDEVRDAMSDDASFTAARTGEQQERAFDVRDGIALLRIQTCKEIHEDRTGRRLQNSIGDRS
jgi:hypothetical protein